MNIRHLLRLGAFALLMVGGGAFAQAADPNYQYTVRPGDTLLSLARLYMTSQNAYLTVQKLNQVRDPRHLVIGSPLMVPKVLLRTEPIIGEISAFRGAVTVSGQPAAIGMAIREGVRVETGANAFATMKLPDGSAISLPSQSRIFVETLRRVMLSGSLDRNFRLEAGRSRSTVTPIKDPSSNFRVTTPLSVSAVRGTDFRVAVESEGGGRALTEVVGGTVGVSPGIGHAETSVPKAYGIVGTPAGLGEPVALLPSPVLVKVEKTDNGAIITSKPVEGASKYRTQLATDLAFQDIFDEAVTDTPSATFTLAGDVKFFVRLTAIAPSGLEGMPRTYALGGGGAPAAKGGTPTAAAGSTMASSEATGAH
jgi:hypothetical protein